MGQLFMGYAYGTTATDPDPVAVAGNQRVYGVDTAAGAVRRYGLGGVVYFDAGGPGAGSQPDNVVDPQQLRQLSADLRAASGDLPLLVAADQEQGTVVRVRDGVTLLPGQMAQGADGQPADVRDAAQVTGSDLLALGIDVNFAPVADVNADPANPVIGERSFGDDPAAVARLTAAAVEGYQAAGV
nr:glycoside hydrolase family 3 N-terminal domain-containing protein [Micromonospora sp. DSM 115978]